MIVGEGSLFGEFGQTVTRGHGLPGRQDMFCSDGEGQVCENQELFGLSTMRVADGSDLGTMRVNEDALLGQLLGTKIPNSALWTLLLGGALVGGSYLLKDEVRKIMQLVGAVVGSAALVQAVSGLSA